MFCRNCGKVIDDNSRFCSYCGTNLFRDSTVESVNNTNSEPDTIEVRNMGKYDRTYKGEGPATFLGLLIIILNIGSYFLMKLVKEEVPQLLKFVVIGLIVIWISVTIWVVLIAKSQNRNEAAWGTFAFFIPGLALFIISLLKKLRID